MKQELQHIYHDLSLGNLMQEDALQRIRALKSSQALETIGLASVVVAAPVWLPGAAPPAEMRMNTQRYVMLCELPHASASEVEALITRSHCLQLNAARQQTLAERYTEHALACFARIKAILQSKPSGPVLVQIVTADADEQAVLAGLGALLKTAALENPLLSGQIILIQDSINAGELARLLKEESAAGGDTMVRYRHGQRHVRRWQIGEDPAQAPPAFKDQGAYLITGGLGGLGLLFTREILRQTTLAKIILTGRSALTADKRAVLEALGAASGRLNYQQLDVTDLAQVRGLITAIQNERGQLTGILHSAGMIADEFLLKKTAEEFGRVLAPKVAGTFNLDRASRDADLDFFVLFSSVASVMGNTGQADYAVANGFLDHFAAYRNALVDRGQRRGRTLSMNWSLWQEGGMRIDPASRQWLRKAAGIEPMQTATGMRALYQGLQSGHAQMLVLEGETALLHRTVAAEAMQPEARVVSSEPKAPAPSDLVEKTQQYLRKQFAALLKLPAQKIDAQSELERYGIDSILAVSLIGQLEGRFGPLSKTLLFEYRTVQALAQYLVEFHASALTALFGSADTPPQAVPVFAPEQPQQITSRRVRRRLGALSATNSASHGATHAEPIAIVGLSGRYPEAPDIEVYWDNLRDGKDCIVEIPKDRWDWREFYSEDRTRGGRHYSKWGGFITGVDEFDPLFFNISPKEAKQIDPQERLFLQHAWMAIEDAGYTRGGLSEAGVYVGVMYSEYQLFGATGSLASIANRVSYAFNLHGPSMTLDTMCSSSLTAIHVACQDLKQGRTQLAIAGGVNVSIHPHKYTVLSAGQFISSDGHCQSFGEGGDGYIPGEGVGVVILKRLSDAQRDGDHIYGLIRGSALNHGGKTNGYTVPNPQAQASAIGRALSESKIDARQIGYIEAHGTGTKLGDPIEIAALSKVFQQHTAQRGYCLIGSAKSNIGHCESAAGIAGLTKVLLQLRHRQIVASLHSARLNPHIDFEQTPFVVNQHLRPWDAPQIEGRELPRVAGISSFGAGGSNAHMIVEEYLPSRRTPVEVHAQVMVPLSARTAEQLKQKATDLLAFLRREPEDSIDLMAMAYTLQVGREAMDERLGLIVSSVAQLTEKLHAFVAGGADIDAAYRGQVKNSKEAVALFGIDADLQQTLDKWLAQRKLAKLLDLWVKGVELDWNKLYAEAKPPRISLPTYPFAKERYWIDAAPAATQAGATVLHPLLHSNTSDLRQQRYTSVFRGDELFFASRKILPAAAYLEMARAAVAQALPEEADASSVLELHETIWGAPLAFAEGLEVSIALLPQSDAQIDFEIYSRQGTEEIIHCQGRALVGRQPAPARLDVAHLELSQLHLAAHQGDYVLHPNALDGMVPGGAGLMGLDSLLILGPCLQDMLAWVRSSGAFTLDVDLCDRGGNICAQLRGLHYRTSSEARVVERNKPAGISLAAPAALDLGAAATSRKIRLVEITSEPVAQIEAGVHEVGNGIVTLQIAVTESQDAIGQLLQALHRAQQIPSIKVLLIRGVETLSQGAREQHEEGVARKLYQAIASFPFPVIGSMQGDAVGAGFMAAALCDFMVCSEAARYGLSFAPNAGEAALLDARFGKALTGQLRYFTTPASGRQLRTEGWTGAVLPVAEVDEYTRKLAASLAAKSTDALRLLKPHLARHLLRLVESLIPIDANATALRDLSTDAEVEETWVTLVADEPSSQNAECAAVAVALNSNVIQAMAHPEGILVVSMEDSAAKNLFSEALVAGLHEVFAHIAATPTYKAVVLTGYGNYFASGGTKETLLAIQQGKAKFTDSTVFRLPVDCEIPVIAAMQGHAIGAGWAMGMFADFVLLSEESHYRSPYMDYGFTPGAAATLIFPAKIGVDLARETLLTAREYAGSELKQRGLALQVLPRAQIRAEALSLARTLAQLPRSRLTAFKQRQTRHLRDSLPETCALELAMHQQTFVGQSQTLQRIETQFLQEPAASHAADDKPAIDTEALPALIATLKKLLARELHMQVEDIDEGAQFIDLGLDSISGVTWIRMINETLRTSIEATKVYAYPTVRQLARYVKEEVDRLAPPVVPKSAARAVTQSIATPPEIVAPREMKAHSAPTSVPAVGMPTRALSSWRKAPRSRLLAAPAAVQQLQAIAVIGMAGQFPKAQNVEEFWRNIAAGHDCIEQVPPQRWNVAAFYQPGKSEAGKTNSRWMGALQEYDRFDPLFFNISPTEAEGMDPQQRLFLQACWHGIESAGYDPRSLSGSKCGVFVGCAGGDYHQLSRAQRLSAQGFTGGANSILSARICYFLNLQGPCLSIDTACSSSLVAIASACDSLLNGASDLALAGGVYVMAGPEMHVKTAQAGMLSPDGRCFAFDQRANGFVPGEAVGVVMLKRLADAERDRDTVYGVIQGWGVNQDGKTNGITAPNPESQTRLQQDVYERFKIDPAGIQLIEAHGTGTKLGDPIEVEALKSSFDKYTRREGYCALGSVKSNIGHCLTAAGIAGFVKLLLALKHRQLPPTINFLQHNEHIQLAGSPFYVNDRLQDWRVDDGELRRAAISSFGFSGTNAHIVIAEHVPSVEVNAPVSVLTQDGRIIVPLSARTEDRLQQKARDLLAFVRERRVDLIELAFTLQVGREPMGERVGFLVDSLQALTAKLEAYVAGASDLDDVYHGQVKRNKDEMKLFSEDDDLSATVVKRCVEQRKLSKLLELWVKGLTPDWNILYGEAKPRRIELPNYPFAKERFWLQADAAPQDRVSPALIHPLLHRNTSSLNQQRYQSAFGAEEFFLDQKIDGARIFPALSLLEMVRAAIVDATRDQGPPGTMVIDRIEWQRPLQVTESTQICVSLFADDDGIRFEIGSTEHEDANASQGVHVQGLAHFSEQVTATRFDLAVEKRQLIDQHFDPAAFYAAAARDVMHIGNALRGLRAVYRGSDRLLARICLPGVLDSYQPEYVLHPGLMESALHACVALAGDSQQPLLPVAVDSVVIVSSCAAEMFVSVRDSSHEQPLAAGHRKVDADLYDGKGNACVLIKGLELSPLSERADIVPAAVPTSLPTTADAWTAQPWDGLSYVCRWQEWLDPVRNLPGAHPTVLIVCRESQVQLEDTIRDHYQQKGSNVVLIRLADRTAQATPDEWLCGVKDCEAFQAALQDERRIDALYFLAQTQPDREPAVLEASDEVQLLRLVKCLKKAKKIDARIDTYILTTDSYSLHDRSGDGWGAGAAGLGYSLAQGCYQFMVRNLDLSSVDLRSSKDRSSVFSLISREPPCDRGEIVKIAGGKRYRQSFFKLNWGAARPSVVRQGGVYIIVGGSGLVGQIFTRHLIRTYGANVVWLGRSAEDTPKIRALLQSFAHLGDKLLYVQADALQLESMQRAVGIAKQKYGAIHGAIFSGMVFGADNSIEQISEDEFKSVLGIKTLGSLAFYEALKEEALDFMCYFSSGQAYSFSGASKVAAYAAGISHADALVRSVRSTAAFPVGTLNWGAWQAFVQERLQNRQDVAAKNMGVLAGPEGVECFERFLGALANGGPAQVLCMRASDEVAGMMGLHRDEILTWAADVSLAVTLGADAIEIPHDKIAQLTEVQASSRLDDWFARLLFHQLNRLVESTLRHAPLTVAQLQTQCAVQDKYLPWLNESLEMLAARQCIELQDGVVRSWNGTACQETAHEWQTQKQAYAQNPETRALASLVDECLQRLPEILQGRVAAADVIFPNSSMQKVAGLYKSNAVADMFNEIAANAVRAYVQQRLHADPRAQIRILEIGAGTGGASAAIFAKLVPFKPSVREYCYTDLSKAFFFHAEEHYVPEHPYIVCRRLDIEQPIEQQGFDAGAYDLVIANNVLHATRNIRRTVRNAKAALHRNGFLLLNEMSDKTLSAHLTVALLDGWWLFEDPQLRIPGCPGLYPAGWQRVLEEEGFSSVEFPAAEGHTLGNQIILARSDGMVRQNAFVGAPTPPAQSVARLEAVARTPASTSRPVGSAGSERSRSRTADHHIRSSVLDCVSGALKIPPHSIETDVAFSDYGIDSILGVNFVNKLNQRLDIPLNTAVIFEYSSVERLSRHIMETFGQQIQATLDTQQQPTAADAGSTNHPALLQRPPLQRTDGANRSRDRRRSGQPDARSDEIAVIGMAGRFPKAESVTEFWNNLIQGIDAVEELPPHYLDRGKYSTRKQKGKTRCQWGGVLTHRDCFDPLFFNLSPREAESMNPHQRLVMQESWNAMEDAGYNPRRLAGTQTGIFVGSEPTNYPSETFTGMSDAIIASRLSYVLNLNGPAFVVNTGCSSSAVALHLACESLRNRETDLALAGGVHACMDQETQIRLDEIEMLSPSGRCYTFDKAGDGTVISEGIAMVVLKRLDAAIAAGDHIYGTIVASGLNQDGASNGITAPSGAAQEQLIRSVYDRFKVNPEQISYVEAHGTGTKLGDPVETNALARAFKRYTDKQGYCAVGSAKAHVGHTSAAAGVTGLIKVLLSMQHRKLPKLLNFRTINPLIEFDGSPFYINTETREWACVAGSPRMAALNSFGHSGTNAHLVIKEYVPATQRRPQSGNGDGRFIIPLSAKTVEQLQEKGRELLAFIRSSSAAIDLASMAYTLQVGREAMEERAGWVVSSVEQLTGKLQTYVEGNTSVDGLRQGRAQPSTAGASDASDDAEQLLRWLAEGSLEKLLQTWTWDPSFDWEALWSARVTPARMSLPGYPFAKERYWIEKSHSNMHAVASRDPVVDTVTTHPARLRRHHESIEDIINRMDDESVSASEVVAMLKMRV